MKQLKTASNIQVTEFFSIELRCFPPPTSYQQSSLDSSTPNCLNCSTAQDTSLTKLPY